MICANIWLAAIAAFGTSHQVSIEPASREAISRLESVFQAVQVPGPYHVTKLVTPGRMLGSAYAVIEDKAGTAHFCDITINKKDERSISIYLEHDYESADIYPRLPYRNPSIERTLANWGHRLGRKETVHLDQVLIDHDHKRGTAYFSILKNGHSFLGGASDFGYTVTFTVPDMRFLAMEAHENPPEVDSSPVFISLDRAVQIAQALAASRFSRSDLVGGRALQFQPGYYLERGVKPTHLAWCVEFTQKTHKADGQQARAAHAAVGSCRIYIDAANGKYLAGYDGLGNPLK